MSDSLLRVMERSGDGAYIRAALRRGLLDLYDKPIGPLDLGSATCESMACNNNLYISTCSFCWVHSGGPWTRCNPGKLTRVRLGGGKETRPRVSDFDCGCCHEAQQ